MRTSKRPSVESWIAKKLRSKALSKDSGIGGKSQRESREVCLNVKGSNYRFERSAGWYWAQEPEIRSNLWKFTRYVGTGIMAISQRIEQILFGYSSGCGTNLVMQASLLSWEIQVQRRLGLGISTFANRTTTSSSSSFSKREVQVKNCHFLEVIYLPLTLSLRIPVIFSGFGPTSKGGTWCTAI